MSKRIVAVGNVNIGESSVSIQSMTNTKTDDIDATISQINALKNAGCQLVRCSVPDEKSAMALKENNKKRIGPDNSRHTFFS